MEWMLVIVEKITPLKKWSFLFIFQGCEVAEVYPFKMLKVIYSYQYYLKC